MKNSDESIPTIGNETLLIETPSLPTTQQMKNIAKKYPKATCSLFYEIVADDEVICRYF